MKNLIGYLKKILFLSSIPFIFFILPQKSLAIENLFELNTTFQHTISEKAISTEAILEISSDTPRVLTYYTASIPISNLNVTCYNANTNTKLECTATTRKNTTDIRINLDNAVIKTNNSLRIKYIYTTEASSINAFNITSQIHDTNTKSVTIIYPKAYGEPLWISDPITKLKPEGEKYILEINEPTYPNTSFLFGENILYKFEISQLFRNTLQKEDQTFELVVPNDTETQTIIWEEISPIPNLSQKDEDGNYIFKYILAPNTVLDCKIVGYIKKHTPSKTKESISSFLTEKVGYWNLNNTNETKRINSYLTNSGLKIPEGFSSAEELDEGNRELLYKYLYSYVVERLNFSEKVELSITNNTRAGATAVSQASDSSTPIDYADFLIAIMRQYGIPARLVIGYVSNISGYTSDGFYHYWVEIYDVDNNKWIVLDPFLEDYFEKRLYKNDFFDHIALLRRGKSTVAPKVTFYNDTDFQVTATPEKEITLDFNFESQISFENTSITDSYLNGYIYVSNTGNIAIDSYAISQSNLENITKYIDTVSNSRSQIILPKQSNTIQLNIPNENVSNNQNIFLNITYSNQDVFNKGLILQSDVHKNVPIILSFFGKFLSIALFSIAIYLIYFLTTKIIKRFNG